MLCGVERFLVELIRVNAIVTVFGMSATQAEILSVLFVLAGMVGLILLRERKAAAQPRTTF